MKYKDKFDVNKNPEFLKNTNKQIKTFKNEDVLSLNKNCDNQEKKSNNNNDIDEKLEKDISTNILLEKKSIKNIEKLFKELRDSSNMKEFSVNLNNTKIKNLKENISKIDTSKKDSELIKFNEKLKLIPVKNLEKVPEINTKKKSTNVLKIQKVEDQNISKLQRFLKAIINSLYFNFLTVFLSFYVIIIDYIKLSFLKSSVDFYLDITKIVILSLFIVELIIAIYCDLYFVKTFGFWMDLLSIITILFDIDLFFNKIFELKRTNSKNFIQLNSKLTKSLNNTRFLKVFNIIKLIRVVRTFSIYKSGINTNLYLKSSYLIPKKSDLRNYKFGNLEKNLDHIENIDLIPNIKTHNIRRISNSNKEVNSFNTEYNNKSKKFNSVDNLIRVRENKNCLIQYYIDIINKNLKDDENDNNEKNIKRSISYQNSYEDNENIIKKEIIKDSKMKDLYTSSIAVKIITIIILVSTIFPLLSERIIISDYDLSSYKIFTSYIKVMKDKFVSEDMIKIINSSSISSFSNLEIYDFLNLYLDSDLQKCMSNNTNKNSNDYYFVKNETTYNYSNHNYYFSIKNLEKNISNDEYSSLMKNLNIQYSFLGNIDIVILDLMKNINLNYISFLKNICKNHISVNEEVELIHSFLSKNIDEDTPLLNITINDIVIYINPNYQDEYRFIETFYFYDNDILLYYYNKKETRQSNFLGLIQLLYTLFVMIISYIWISNDFDVNVFIPFETISYVINKTAKDPANSDLINNFHLELSKKLYGKQSIIKSKYDKRKVVKTMFKRDSKDVEFDKMDEIYEVKLVCNSMLKIMSLLAVGIGESGSEIIKHNLINSNDYFNKNIKGTKIDGIYMFVGIKRYNELNSILMEDLIIYINCISDIVHRSLKLFNGIVNRNLGDLFLCNWSFNLKNNKRRAEMVDIQNIADGTLLSILTIIINLKNSNEFTYLLNRVGYFSTFENLISFGLHLGSGIKGAVGTNLKVDFTYLSPNVNISSRFQSLTKSYGVTIIFSDDLFKLLSHKFQIICRLIDIIKVKGSKRRIQIYTLDICLKKNRSKFNFSKMQLLCEEIYNNNSILSDVILNQIEYSEIIDKRFTKQFYSMFKEGLRSYLDGNWNKSREILNQCLEITHDFPTLNILNFMNEYKFKAPKNWKGYREYRKKN